METMIQWLCDGVELPAVDYNRVDTWLREVTRSHSRVLGPLTYIFCNDDKIIEVNRQYLQHDYYTDIITFDYTRGRRVSGDMFISLDLWGINDKGPGEREIMESHEDEALRMLGDINGLRLTQ